MKLLIVFLLCRASDAFLAPSGRPRITASVHQQTRGGIVTLTCHRPADDGTPDCDDFTWTKVEGNLGTLPNTQNYQFTMDARHHGLYTCQCSNLWGSSDYSLQAYVRLLETITTPAPTSCGTPGAIPNGVLKEVTTTGLGGVATYTCDAGYTMPGMAFAVCLGNGQWTTLPTCVPDCGTPGAIANGRITQETGTTRGGTTTYACDEGFTMQGSATVTCQNNSQWAPLPTCVPESPGQPTVVTSTQSQFEDVIVNLTCLYNQDCATYSWKRLEGNIHFLPMVYTLANFLLFPMDSSTAGNYTCKCNNQHGGSNWSETVQVFSQGLKPTIVASTNEEYDGDDVTLTCTIPDNNNDNNNNNNSNPAPCTTYRWTRLEGNLNYLPNTATYTFTMDTRHQGNYTCQCVEKDIASMTSDPVNVSSLGAKTAEISEPENEKSIFDDVTVIAGIAAGGFALVALVTTAICVCKRRSNRNQPKDKEQTGDDNWAMEARPQDGAGARGNVDGENVEPNADYQPLSNVRTRGHDYVEIVRDIPALQIVNPAYSSAIYNEIM